LVYQAMFFQEIDGAVDGDQMYAGIDFLRAFQDLVHIEVLLGIIHHLQNDPALSGQAQASLPQRLLQSPGCFRGIEALTGRNPVLRRCGHPFLSERADNVRCAARVYEWTGSNRTTSLYITYANSTKRNTKPT